MFVASITGGKVKGAMLRMGNSVRDIDIKASKLRPAETYDGFQSDQNVAIALRYPTDLKAISTTDSMESRVMDTRLPTPFLQFIHQIEFPRSFAWDYKG